jgi:hypothetical protein
MPILTSSCKQVSILVAFCLQTISKCASWVILLAAALAALQCPDWCLHSRSVSTGDAFNVVPTNQLDLVPLSPGRVSCVSIIGWCEIEEENHDNEQKWEFLRTTLLASCQNSVSTSQDVPYTQDESGCI